MRPFEVPSKSQCQDDEYISTFLSNYEFRKLYNKIVGNVKKFQNKSASCWFLRQCIQEQLIPTTFRIRNKLHKNGNLETEERWYETSKEASINHMNAALK